MAGKKQQFDASNVPPQNLEAEQAVLGGLLLDQEAMAKVLDIITGEDFYRPDHGLIYETCSDLFAKNQPIDLITLTNALETKKKLKDVGGASYLSSLVANTASAANIVHHANIVQSKAVLRRLISTANSISAQAYDESRDAIELLDEAEKKLFDVADRRLGTHFVAIKNVLSDSFERIDELHKNKGKTRGVASGFHKLDELLAGFQPSDLIILAARPSMGKTALALNIAAYAAVKSKLPVGIFSLEMSKEQLVDRLLTMEAMIDSWRLRTGNLEESDFSKLNYAMGELSEAPLFIDDTPLLSALEIKAKARRLQAEHGLGLIVVDYLQLMEGSKKGGSEINRVQEVSDISRSLKALARELKVPVLALSQLSRAVEGRPGTKIPQLSDLRDSGSIEQDADVVMFIYREEYYEPETEKKGIAQILIRKHRNGPLGEVELYFHPEYSRFANMEKERNYNAEGE
ncbi:MAG TPA: replicative DNA helicase [bacterium]|jgi:replicative DNA helicase|nr:replicative DNA helicase [bacterium]HOR57699.1 replicative DNA helicase [bacterium]HPL56460.1 replicative DNA helicase [bacterium]HPM27935.1 replicative DNA helicase [bacterium]